MCNTHDAKTWAKWIWVMDRLQHGRQRNPFEEPRLLVQQATRNVILCDAPVERFSSDMPVWIPPSPDEDKLMPIDVLYGCYDAVARSITIFVRRIKSDAPRLNTSFDELLQVVRLHEYVHAVCHLGVPDRQVASALGSLGDNGCTDWAAFLERRTDAHRQLGTESHEFLAQAITYACLLAQTGQRGSRLRDVFEALEKKQPRHYVLSEEVKTAATAVDWSLVLRTARQELDVPPGDGFVMHEGLLALVNEFTPDQTGACTDQQEWVVPLHDEAAIAQLGADLAASGADRHTGNESTEFLVDRFAGLRVEIFAREHPPPHFRVSCGEDSASYQIRDCVQLNGGLRREYRAIRGWHARNKDKLIAAWNQSRPSGCPVGQYHDT